MDYHCHFRRHKRVIYKKKLIYKGYAKSINIV